jgi:hypothetical protein
MLSMRLLLASDPLLPPQAREALAQNRNDARDHLVRLGVDECEAAELLDLPCEPEVRVLSAACPCGMA